MRRDRLDRMERPRAVIFDLDETLAESFQPPKPDMIDRLARLLEHVPVAIMSGAGFDRIEKDFLNILEKSPHIDRLFIFPNSATQGYIWQNGWQEQYNFSLTPGQRAFIKNVFAQAEKDLSIIRDAPRFGERIADREAQIAFTVVGLDAPQDVKMAWDPSAAKRRVIRDYLVDKLPDYDIRTGGASTIDVTAKGINKTYGVYWLAKRLSYQPEEMLYVGDALYEGGNDAVVVSTKIQTTSVSGPAETLTVIDELLARFAAAA